MKTETLHVPITALRAALQTAAKDDVRYYLCGILLERLDGHVRLVSTDGHTLFAYRVEREQPGADLAVILPREIIQPLRRPRANAEPAATITLTWETNETGGTGPCKVRIEANDVALEGLEIDGRFPDWRRVIPETVSGDPAQYDGGMLCRFVTISHELFGKGKELAPFHLYSNGDGPGLICFLDDHAETMVGVVMPFRSRAPEETRSWVRSVTGGLTA